MNLDEFVKLTLSQIVKGVDEASSSSKGRIAPEIGMGDDAPKILRTDASHGFHGVFLVEFDVALAAADKSEVGGSGGAKVYVISVQGETHKTAESSSVHRVKFSVPISYQPSSAQ